MISRYKLQAFFLILALYLVLGFGVSIAVHSLSQGFGITTVALIVLYAVGAKLSR